MRRSILVFAAVAIVVSAVLGPPVASAEMIVRNADGELVGELIGIWGEDPGLWVVHNAAMDRLMVVESFSGWMGYTPEGCPYFKDNSDCNGQAYLDRKWFPWVTRCGSRYFVAKLEYDDIDQQDEKLNWAGSCGGSGAPFGGITVVLVDEIQQDDFPFTLRRGPLQLERVAAVPTSPPVDAVAPAGIATLVVLIAASGVILVRRLG